MSNSGIPTPGRRLPLETRSLASTRPSLDAERRYRERLRQADARIAQATTPGARAAAMKERDDVWTAGAFLRKAGMR